jgi:hypothetical protein
MAVLEATITLRLPEIEKLAAASFDASNCEGGL